SIRVVGAFDGTIAAGSVGTFRSGSGFVTLNTSGAIGSITGTGENGLGLELSASKVGAINVVGALNGDGIDDGADWNVTGGIASVTAASIGFVDVQAKFLGPVNAKGSTTFGISGDIADTTFTLTGDDGLSDKLGLKSLTAKRNVLKTLFDVEAGNVGAVTVGRFMRSRLYLNYTPSILGDFTLGSFGTKKFKLTSFKT